MRRRDQFDPAWLTHSLFQPRHRSLPSRAAGAAATGAGRLVAAGGRQVGTRWRPAMPLLVATAAHVVATLLYLVVAGFRHLHQPAHQNTINLILVVFVLLALAPMWWVAAGWPTARRRRRVRPWRGARLAHLGSGSALLVLYLPVTVWWLPPWRCLGSPWLPAVAFTAAVSVGMWAWSYWGWYKTREVEELAPLTDTPEAIWEEYVGAAGGVFPGSRLTEVRDITKAST